MLPIHFVTSNTVDLLRVDNVILFDTLVLSEEIAFSVYTELVNCCCKFSCVTELVNEVLVDLLNTNYAHGID
jgi:hypothetical protein